MHARAALVVGSLAAIAGAAVLAARNVNAATLPASSAAAANDGAVESFDLAALDYGTPAVDAPAESAPGFLSGAADAVLAPIDSAVFSLTGFRLMNDWRKAALDPKNAPYVQAMQVAETAHGIPPDLLVRQAWQESRFNPNARNPSGATGILQIIPRWHPGVDATDPFDSIDYAAEFLASLYHQFGTWELALKAYNWGPANVKKWQAGQLSEPLETKNYSAQILADVVIA